MVDNDGITAELLNKFESVLETSLIYAILSDFNLSDSSELERARDTLEKLQQSARAEEDTGFDASASSAVNNPLNYEERSRGDDTGSQTSWPGWSSSTDDVEFSQGVSSPDLDKLSLNGDNLYYETELNSLDQETKEAMLIEMFPGLRPFDVRYTLEKDKWSLNNTINDLMTQLCLEEIGSRHRGIEGFSENVLSPKSRKGKARKKRNRPADDSSNLTSPITPDTPTNSKWDTGQLDIEFIASSTGKPNQEIAFLYHKNGASIRTTIKTLLEAQASLKAESYDSLMESNAVDLGHEFPSLPRHLLLPLIEITHPSMASAHELARALIHQPSSNKSGIQIEFRHAPLESHSALPPPKASAASNLGLTLDTAAGQAAQYSKEREDNFTKARAAYRKSKSNHLMSGAAAYYSELGRTADAQLKIAQSAAADALVASQSSQNQLDLHGVNVQDGRRIAKERVTAWWHELGENRFSGRGALAEYRIVTGVGYHSEGGRSRLAPAILKMLMNDGWKVQVGTGVLTVTGVVKK